MFFLSIPYTMRSGTKTEIAMAWAKTYDFNFVIELEAHVSLLNVDTLLVTRAQDLAFWSLKTSPSPSCDRCYRVLYVQVEKADGRRRVFSGWKLVIVIWKVRGKFLNILVTVFKVILLRLISCRLTLFHLTTLPHPKNFYCTLPYSMHPGDS